MRTRPISCTQRVIPSSSSVHDGLSGTLAKSLVEVGTMVLSEIVTGKRLTTVLVNSLEDLLFSRHVSCSFLPIASR